MVDGLTLNDHKVFFKNKFYLNSDLLHTPFDTLKPIGFKTTLKNTKNFTFPKDRP